MSTAAARETIDAATVREWSERYSNAGRWQRDEARGALNFITQDCVLGACALPRQGLVVSCALPFDRRAPQTTAPNLQHTIVHRRADGDEAEIRDGDATAPHGEAGETRGAARSFASQWSAHANVFYDDCPAPAGVPDKGERRRRAGPWRDPIQDAVVGRGVLLDLPLYLRRPWLDDATRILPRDLDNCAEALGVTVERGDIVLVRTGRMTRCFHEGHWDGYRGGPAPGLSVHCARWLHEVEAAVVATDTWSVEVTPSESTECERPLHQIAQRRMGLLFGEMFHLDTLSEACAVDGNYAFLFTAPLLPMLGAVGYPINPLAIK